MTEADSAPDDPGSADSESSDFVSTHPQPLDEDERAELERLREEVAVQISEPRPTRHVWRTTGVVVLVVLCGVLSLASVAARYVRSEILDSDHYVAMVTPLASDPAVQQQLVDTITTEINNRVDIEQTAANALQNLTELTPANRPRVDAAIVGLAPVIASQAQDFVRSTVQNFVESDQFRDAWIAANRVAHKGVVAAVTGRTDRAALDVARNGTISIQLGPIIDQVKQRLVQRGFGFASQIPEINKQFVLVQSEGLARAQSLVRVLDTAASILPWLAIAAAAGAVALGVRGRRLRALTAVGLSVVTAMSVLAIGIVIGRAFYLREIPTAALSADAARAIFDTAVGPLRTALRAVAVVGIVIAAIGFFAGGSRAANAIRGGARRGFGAVDAKRSTRPASAVEKWAWQARNPLRAGTIGIGALIVMCWHYPTGMVVVWTVVLTCLALVVLEFVIAPGRRGARLIAAEHD